MLIDLVKNGGDNEPHDLICLWSVPVDCFALLGMFLCLVYWVKQPSLSHLGTRTQQALVRSFSHNFRNLELLKTMVPVDKLSVCKKCGFKCSVLCKCTMENFSGNGTLNSSNETIKFGHNSDSGVVFSTPESLLVLDFVKCPMLISDGVCFVSNCPGSCLVSEIGEHILESLRMETEKKMNISKETDFSNQTMKKSASHLKLWDEGTQLFDCPACNRKFSDCSLKLHSVTCQQQPVDEVQVQSTFTSESVEENKRSKNQDLSTSSGEEHSSSSLSFWSTLVPGSVVDFLSCKESGQWVLGFVERVDSVNRTMELATEDGAPIFKSLICLKQMKSFSSGNTEWLHESEAHRVAELNSRCNLFRASAIATESLNALLGLSEGSKEQQSYGDINSNHAQLAAQPLRPKTRRGLDSSDTVAEVTGGSVNEWQSADEEEALSLRSGNCRSAEELFTVSALSGQQKQL